MRKYLHISLLALFILPQATFAQPIIKMNLQRIDKIPLEAKYQTLELAAPLAKRQELETLRAIGIQKNWTFQIGITSVADLDVSLITGALPPDAAGNAAGSNSSNVAPTMGAGVANPNAASFDLRTLGLVSPVRDQSQCGSCWAFASIASVETAHILRNKVNANAIDLSEQQMLNCSGSGTCGGGQVYKVLDYLKTHFAANESAYPYTHTDHACSLQGGSAYKVENWGWVGGNSGKASVSQIKAALVNYGAVSSHVWVNHSFQYYTGGVLNDNTRHPENIHEEGHHVVQIIGWNDNLHAWLIKNSWGTGWGMNGIVWIDYDVLEIGTQVTWTVANAVSVGSNCTGNFAVYGYIGEKYAALKGSSGFLGCPLTSETGTPDGVGRYNHFQGGSIYWTPKTGAHEVHGLIRDKWASVGWERGYGYPVTDESGTPDGRGRYNHFTDNRSIYWTPQTGAHLIYGVIRDKWASMGWERSSLGYPISDEMDSDRPDFKRMTKFEKGKIYWRADLTLVQ